MIRVIIADDSIHIRYWISRVLSRDADILVVGEACDGLDTVDRIEADEPDVLILDIAMPVLDGVDVVRWLKRNRKTTPRGDSEQLRRRPADPRDAAPGRGRLRGERRRGRVPGGSGQSGGPRRGPVVVEPHRARREWTRVTALMGEARD